MTGYGKIGFLSTDDYLKAVVKRKLIVRVMMRGNYLNQRGCMTDGETQINELGRVAIPVSQFTHTKTD